MSRNPESKHWRRKIVKAAENNHIELEPGRGYAELAGLERTIRYAMSQPNPYKAVDHVIDLLAELDYDETFCSFEPDMLAANTLQARSNHVWYFVSWENIANAAMKICAGLEVRN